MVEIIGSIIRIEILMLKGVHDVRREKVLGKRLFDAFSKSFEVMGTSSKKMRQTLFCMVQ